MSKEERIEIKLGMIYEQLFNIQWKLDKIENDRRKKEAEDSKRISERELEEIKYRENDYWNLKEQKMKEFNYYNGEVECGSVIDNG